MEYFTQGVFSYIFSSLSTNGKCFLLFPIKCRQKRGGGLETLEKVFNDLR